MFNLQLTLESRLAEMEARFQSLQPVVDSVLGVEVKETQTLVAPAINIEEAKAELAEKLAISVNLSNAAVTRRVQRTVGKPSIKTPAMKKWETLAPLAVAMLRLSGAPKAYFGFTKNVTEADVNRLENNLRSAIRAGRKAVRPLFDGLKAVKAAMSELEISQFVIMLKNLEVATVQATLRTLEFDFYSALGVVKFEYTSVSDSNKAAQASASAVRSAASKASGNTVATCGQVDGTVEATATFVKPIPVAKVVSVEEAEANFKAAGNDFQAAHNTYLELVAQGASEEVVAEAKAKVDVTSTKCRAAKNARKDAQRVAEEGNGVTVRNIKAAAKKENTRLGVIEDGIIADIFNLEYEVAFFDFQVKENEVFGDRIVGIYASKLEEAEAELKQLNADLKDVQAQMDRDEKRAQAHVDYIKSGRIKASKVAQTRVSNSIEFNESHVEFVIRSLSELLCSMKRRKGKNSSPNVKEYRPKALTVKVSAKGKKNNK